MLLVWLYVFVGFCFRLGTCIFKVLVFFVDRGLGDTVIVIVFFFYLDLG